MVSRNDSSPSPAGKPGSHSSPNEQQASPPPAAGALPEGKAMMRKVTVPCFVEVEVFSDGPEQAIVRAAEGLRKVGELRVGPVVLRFKGVLEPMCESDE